MKVLDLQCGHGHSFEGWFGSEDDFQSQLLRKLVECPMCGNCAIVKKLSAPRLNLGAKPPAQAKQSSEPDAASLPSGAESSKAAPSKELSVVESAAPVSQQQTDMAVQALELMQRPEF